MEHDWIQTHPGRQFWPLPPEVRDLCIEDIAHALALFLKTFQDLTRKR